MTMLNNQRVSIQKPFGGLQMCATAQNPPMVWVFQHTTWMSQSPQLMRTTPIRGGVRTSMGIPGSDSLEVPSIYKAYF